MPCPQIFFGYDGDLSTFILLDAMVSHILISIHYCTIHHSIQKTPLIQYYCDVMFNFYIVSLWLPLDLMDLLFSSCCHFMMMLMWVSGRICLV